jgi:6-phosphogluconolactonase
MTEPRTAQASVDGPRPAVAAGPTRVLVGGYAGPPAVGITALGLAPGSGDLLAGTVHTDIPNPFHLLRAGRHVYAASNVAAGRVYALEIAAGGGLDVCNDQPTGGAGTIHLGLHPGGRYLYATDHDSGTVSVLPVAPDGTLAPVVQTIQHLGAGANPDAQAGPHPHMAVPDPTGARLLVPDKGTDQVHVYTVDGATGMLAPHSQVHLGAGAGPRQLVFAPDGRHAYVINELVSAVTVCGYEPRTGALWTLGSTPTVPADHEGWNAPAALVAGSDGRFLYAANRGHESVAVLAVGAGGGSLRLVANRPVGTPVTTLPWDLALAGDRLYVANQLAGTVASLAVDRSTGLLTPAGPTVHVPNAACLAVV